MRNIELIDNTNEVEYWFETKDGKKLKLPYYFTNRVDLANLMLYAETETDKFPTVNELVDNGELFVKYGYVKVEKNYRTYNANRISIPKAIAFFKKHGFNVTEEAIKHNLAAYRVDMKSGYRDEENGYHLFTPCGCNPLSLRLTSLNKNCDWQKTYVF